MTASDEDPARHTSPLTIAVVYPDLLGTYGDGGNGMILARRAAWRGVEVELVEATSDRPLPEADLYCLGGGEDGPQVRASVSLRQDGALHRAVARGAVVLGVCAGYQLLGHSFPDGADRAQEGLGLLDVSTRKGSGRRAVGELLASPAPDAPRRSDGRPLPMLSGFENHGGVTTVGGRARVLSQVVRGVGNGSGDGSEGAWSGRVVGSYLHGPLLARNTELADLLLEWAMAPAGGPSSPLAPLDDTEESSLRGERLTAVSTPTGSGLVRRLRSRRH